MLAGGEGVKAQWTTQVVSSQDIWGVSFGDANHGWAVGGQGLLMRTSDGGHNWVSQNSGAPAAYLEGVCFTSSTTGTFVGSGGLIRRTTNGGTTWTTQTSGTTQTLYSVFFIDANNGWIVGSGGTLLRTTNGGATWTPTVSGVDNSLFRVHFADATTGWTVGTSGVILKSTNGGATWTPQTSGVSVNLLGVRFASATTGWVVGQKGVILKTTDGGATWKKQRAGTTQVLWDVRCANENLVFIAGNGGSLLKTLDGGSSWKKQPGGGRRFYFALDLVNAGLLHATGSDGTISRYYAGDGLDQNTLLGLAIVGGARAEMPDSPVSKLGEAFVNASGRSQCVVEAAGASLPGRRAQLMLNSFSALTPALRMVGKRPLNDYFPGNDGQFIGPMSGLICNRPDAALYQIGVTGAGAGPVNWALLRDNGSSLIMLARKGFALSGLGGPVLNQAREVLQSHDQNALTISYVLRRGGAPVVDKSNDTGLLTLANNTGAPLAVLAREGQPAFGGGGIFGEFPGRGAAAVGATTHFMAGFVPDSGGRAVPGLFNMGFNGGSPARFALQGADAAGIPDAKWRTFTAFSQSEAAPLLRATLSGKGVKTASNEGIWQGSNLWLRKGVTDLGGGLVASRIVRFWPVAANQMVAQVILKGSGVTSRNNQALLLRQSNGQFLTLLRTGQAPPNGMPSASIRTFQAIDVNPQFGFYAVLVGLQGAPADHNQMLLMGQTQAGNDTTLQHHRLPFLALAKGGTYQTDATPAGVVRSLALKPVVERTGAGGRGRGQVTADGATVLEILGPHQRIELVRILPYN